MAFVDAIYANDHQKCQFTTGFVFTYCGGAIVCQSKMQTVTAISSTEAEFLAAISCAKITLYLRFMLEEFGFPCYSPTRMYEDNASTIMIVNLQVPTKYAQHIYVQYFCHLGMEKMGLY